MNDSVTPLKEPFAVAVPHRLQPFITELDYDSHDLNTLISIESVEHLFWYRNNYDNHQGVSIRILLNKEIANRLETALVHNNATDFVLLLVDDYVVSAFEATPNVVEDYIDLQPADFEQGEFPGYLEEPLHKITDYGEIIGYNGDLGSREDFWMPMIEKLVEKRLNEA